MSHAVHYRDAAGDVHLEDRPSLDAALELVERLQNEEHATEVRVFREVPIEVKTYYRVVAVDGGENLAVPVDGVTPVAVPVVAEITEPQGAPATEPVTAPVGERPEAPAAETDVVEEPAASADAPAEPAVAAAPRLAPVEPPSGATIMSPPPVSIAPAEDAGDDHDAEPRAEHRRQLFSRG